MGDENRRAPLGNLEQGLRDGRSFSSSRAEVGSSSTSTLGLASIARAIAMRALSRRERLATLRVRRIGAAVRQILAHTRLEQIG